MIMLIVALISGVIAFAQTTIEGFVVDGTKEPIIGASVFVKGTSTGTATDIAPFYHWSDVKAFYQEVLEGRK